mmetsp:Transcript_15100/g.25808  ORF Transcript_15100/g.25808 Transcript_15100/m.25808 type:complete len:171 (-) Transcript_15100:36-548(-)
MRPDAPASMPASASASHDFDELPPSQVHRQDSAHLYTDDNGSTHIYLRHSGAPNTSDPYTPQYVSTNVSSQHSGGSRDIDYPGVGIWLHDGEATDVVVGVGALVGDQRVDGQEPQLVQRSLEQQRLQPLAVEVAVGGEQAQSPGQEHNLPATSVLPGGLEPAADWWPCWD